jgi:hypothetical protein
MKYTIIINEKRLVVPNFLTNEGRQTLFRRVFSKSARDYLTPDYGSFDTDPCYYAFNFIDAEGFITATVNDTLQNRQWNFFEPDIDLTSHSVWIPLFEYKGPGQASFHSDSIGTRYPAQKDGKIIGIALVIIPTRQFPETLISIGLFNGIQPVKYKDEIYVGYELDC